MPYKLSCKLLILLPLAIYHPLCMHAQEPPTIEEKTRGMNKLDGYFPLYWDNRDGSLWLEISRFDNDFLYVTGLAAGLGSNDIGLDRGQQGESAIVYFQRT